MKLGFEVAFRADDSFQFVGFSNAPPMLIIGENWDLNFIHSVPLLSAIVPL